MPHNIQRHIANILRQRIVTTAHEGQGPACDDHVDGCARAGPEEYVALQLSEANRFGLPCGRNQFHGVFDKGRVNIHAVGATLQGDHFFGIEDGLQPPVERRSSAPR